ncbi:putative Gonadotropin-releasing hormone II receptor [Hypsibius exemplaris]|uniref:Gonadotropin-releasing hormone II receptor n=1 Tax=Hypsibius exemplaris TaxID=2072580 RepID=A0A1W0WBE1_HYPEX|nr:putative Gonadotropin-releasing hormone II receptor [Hypsibius exemplaris]
MMELVVAAENSFEPSAAPVMRGTYFVAPPGADLLENNTLSQQPRLLSPSSSSSLVSASEPAMASAEDYLPPEMKFTFVNTIVIAIYANLFWISLVGNLIVFSRLVRKKKKSRVHILLINLCTADIMVTLIEMPLKIAWKTTVQWTGGDIACRIMSCLRVFGLYLSALLLIAISIDRFLAIWDPMSSVRRAGQRTRIMIFLAWIISVACAAPQAVIWHVLQHPEFSWYHQCVTFGSFATASSEMAYGLMTLMLTYGLPLLTILFCYLGIWLRIFHTSIEHGHMTTVQRRDTVASLRTSNSDRLTKAKKRTLKMTFFIVGIFVLCWSPYQIMSMWYFFDRGSAQRVNQLAQEILFIFGVSSSVLNPYVYGMYSMGIWRNVNIFSHFPCLRKAFGTESAIESNQRDSSICIRVGDDCDTLERSRTGVVRRVDVINASPGGPRRPWSHLHNFQQPPRITKVKNSAGSFLPPCSPTPRPSDTSVYSLPGLKTAI